MKAYTEVEDFVMRSVQEDLAQKIIEKKLVKKFLNP